MKIKVIVVLATLIVAGISVSATPRILQSQLKTGQENGISSPPGDCVLRIQNQEEIVMDQAMVKMQVIAWGAGPTVPLTLTTTFSVYDRGFADGTSTHLRKMIVTQTNVLVASGTVSEYSLVGNFQLDELLPSGQYELVASVGATPTSGNPLIELRSIANFAIGGQSFMIRNGAIVSNMAPVLTLTYYPLESSVGAVPPTLEIKQGANWELEWLARYADFHLQCAPTPKGPWQDVVEKSLVRSVTGFDYLPRAYISSFRTERPPDRQEFFRLKEGGLRILGKTRR